MPQRGGRDPDRKKKTAVRKGLEKAQSREEREGVLDLGRQVLGFGKLNKVLKDQKELNQRAAKKAKVEVVKQEVKEETPVKEEPSSTTSGNSSSSSCKSTELQAELKKCTGLGVWQ